MALRTADQADGLRASRGNPEGAKVVRLRRANASATRTIAVTSGKGGVGKTQIAANLAVGLARRGLSVVLFDADLGLASLDLALGLSPEWDLRAVFEGDKRIDEILVEGPSGVKLLPACPGRYEMANLGPSERDAIANVVDEVARGFDVLVIDTGAGIGGNAVSFASSADDVLLVSTPDPTSVRDAYAMAKVLNRRRGIAQVHFVANQVASETEGAELHSCLQAIVRRFLTLELGYLGCVPSDDAVRQAVVAREPFLLRSPHSIAARATEALVRRLEPQTPAGELC